MSGALLARQGRIKDKYGLAHLFGTGMDYGQGRYLLPPHPTARLIRYTPGGSNTGPTVVGGYTHYTRTTMAGCKALVRVCPTDATASSQGTVVSALTSSGTTATATVLSTTGIISGVTEGLITGATPEVFNGHFVLTVIDGTHVSYRFAGNSNNSAAVLTGSGFTQIGLKFGYGDRVLLPQGGFTYVDQYGETSHAQGISRKYPFMLDTYDPADPTNVSKYGRALCEIDCEATTYPIEFIKSIGRYESFIVLRAVEMKSPLVENQAYLFNSTGRHSNILLEGCVVEGTQIAIQGNAHSLTTRWPITSLTSVGTTATAVVDPTLIAQLQSGMHGTVTGAGVAAFNKLADITIVNATTFTYPITDSGGAAGGGTPLIRFGGNFGDFRGVMEFDVARNVVANRCGFGYANPKGSGRAQGIFLDMARTIRMIDCVFHHGGWAASATRLTAQVNWDPKPELVITALSQVGGLATATVASTAGLATGYTRLIQGANQAGYNIKAVITVTDGTHFTYAVAGGTVSPATGSPIAYPSILSLTQTGGLATATVDTTALMTTGEFVSVGGVVEGSYSYNMVTPITVTDATHFTYPVDPLLHSPGVQASATLGMYVLYEERGSTWDHEVGHSPNIFNHNWYVSNNTDDIKAVDCLSAFDAANLKCTGGEWTVRRLVNVYDPIGGIWNNWGNEVNSWSLPTRPMVRNFDQLQLGSDDINNDNPRGNGPTPTGVLSLWQNTLLLNQNNANPVNRAGISAGLPAPTTIPSTITARHYIAASWGPHIDADEGLIVKEWDYCITEDASPLTGAGNYKRTTTCPAHMQTKIAAALARTVSTWRAAEPELASVSAGGDDRATAANVMDFCFRNPHRPWAKMLQRYVREPLGR